MVLEGMAALGLASNIIQLIDFSYKLVSGAKEIRNSAAGVSAQHETFETVSQSLVQLVNNIDGTSSSQIPPEIRDLATQTKDLAQSFIAELDKLKRKRPKRPWSGFIQAMKEANKSDKLLALNKRLNKLQKTLNSHLLSLMRRQLVQINEMIMEDQRLHLQTTVEVRRLRNDIMAELGNLAGQGQLGELKVAEHLKNLENPAALGIENSGWGKKKANGRASEDEQEEENEIGQEDVKLLSQMFAKLSEDMRFFPAVANTAWTRHSLLMSLWYEGMRDRQQIVPMAHSKTLNWVFDGSVPKSYQGPNPGFVEWLEHEDGIFWVHGKPGSGKSTLMKFFANHSTTKQLLETWAAHNRKRLVFASHFFWIAGGTLQRSQKGLLRTLLFNILRDCPDLIPYVYPGQEAMHYPTEYEEWTFQELNKAFSKLKSQTEVRICLFIDGLDEYDPDTHEGSYEEMIKTLIAISESPDIKICVSSRSWYVFKDAFSKGEDGEVSKWAVALEDLNRPDIEGYVNSSFGDNARFRDLSTRDPRYPALLRQVVQKSQGVFLWVFLVVRSLLKGLTYADRISDLQKRLDRIPDDLNDYFDQILGSVDDFYLKETAEIFQIMLKSRAGVPLLALSFFFEEDQDYVFKIQGHCPIDRNEISRRCDETRRRLDGRCRGLVEVDTHSSGPAYYFKVQFLHRTVRDFLENKAMEKLFRKLDPQFDANVSAARSYLALIKTTVPEHGDSTGSNMCNELLFHGRKYEIRTSKALVDVLNEAKTAMQCRVAMNRGKFLALAAAGNVWLYLLRVIETDTGITEKERGTLLLEALTSWSPDDPEAQHFHKDFIECLLQKGTSPNEPNSNPRKVNFGNRTPWECFLHILRDRDISGTNENDLFEITKSFIVHGAHSSTKDEVRIILEAEHVLSIEQRKELVKLLKSRRASHLIERGSKNVRKLMDKILDRMGLVMGKVV